MVKNAPHGYVAQQFTIHSGYVPAQGDVVGLTASMEVAASGFIGKPIGRVTTIADDKISWVVVDMFAPMILEQTAGTGGVTAGDQLKTSAANTVVTAAPGTTLTDVPLAWGRALNTATATNKVFVLPRN